MVTSTKAFALAAMFLPLALASPFHMERHANPDVDVKVVTDVDMVFETAFQTVYATDGAPAPAPETKVVTQAAPSSSPAPETTTTTHQRGGHHWTYTRQSTSTTSTSTPPPPPPSPTSISIPEVTSAPETPSIAPAPAPTTSATQAVAPASWGGNHPSLGNDSFSADTGALQANVLNSTNAWRQRFQAAPVTWNESLTAEMAAARDADDKRCQFTHALGPYGSNLWESDDWLHAGPLSAIDAWGSEYKNWDFNAGTNTSQEWGHFTLLVWQESTSIGCVDYVCPHTNDGALAFGRYLICNFYPGGNMAIAGENSYKKNVLPEKS